jgi:uncharacterized protein YndB with AHSA1/START domain
MQTSQDNTKHSSSGTTPQPPLLELQRQFTVPVEKLFDAFTSSEAVKIWWWPKDLYADRVDLDFSEGGKYFFNMKGFEQGGGGMTGRFEEIVKNKRIVMTDQFADAQGNPISAQEAKMPGDWPEMIHITFDFESVGDETSRLKLSQTGIPSIVQEDCKQGWSESFDKLERYLRKS